MKITSSLLSEVIQDHKERTPIGTSPFGEIFFREKGGKGGQVYSICQITPPTRPPNNPAQKGDFMFRFYIIATSEKEFQNFWKTGSRNMFGRKYKQFEEEYYIYMDRYDLLKELVDRLGHLEQNEVYGYCAHDDYNSKNPFAEKVDMESYFIEILEYNRKNPRNYYNALWDLNSKDEYGPRVQTKYFSYWEEIPEDFLSCYNLKSLAIWHNNIDNLYPNLLKFQNLNSLHLTELEYPQQELLDNLYRLPYLVDLVLSDEFSPKLEQVPPKLDELKSLRYFDFSGHSVSDWSRLVTLVSLKKLALSRTGLTSISEEISNLVELEELDLSNNDIKELPEALKQLPKLKKLNLSKNPLIKLPDWLGEMTQLEELDVCQTQLKTIPESLTALPNLKNLNLKKNPFESMPKAMSKIPKKALELEMRNVALYDAKAKAKMDKYPKGDCLFENDFNFKLMVVNQLMYVDEVLLPKFEVREFAENYSGRAINIEEEGYNEIPEVRTYFEQLKIPMELLIDIKELKPDGGDHIYGELIPFWDGEDEHFDVQSIEDVKYLPNLKATNTMNFSKELVKELRSRKIKVANY